MRVDFSRVADYYDDSRGLPDHILRKAYRRLLAANTIKVNSEILDAGCGTGQISLPLIVAGLRVTCVDVSAAMLRRARAKVPRAREAAFAVADVCALPFKDSAFDAVIASKLFMHVPNWRGAIREILRATRAGGHFIHLSERGLFMNAVRARFREESIRRGYTTRFAGVESRDELNAYFHEAGAVALPGDEKPLSWTKTITYAHAFEELEIKSFAEFWVIPDDEYTEMLEDLRIWVETCPAGMATIQQMTPSLTVEAFLLP
jgi:ubiquinone/menaquinone biosynthesis C-methylase UbiE